MTKKSLLALLGAWCISLSPIASSDEIFNANLNEDQQATPNLSTAAFKARIAQTETLLIDSRTYAEFAISHIPGAQVVGAKPGSTREAFTSDVEEIKALAQQQLDTPVVVYCAGLYCGKAKRVAQDLVAAGFTDVSRYQLGIPLWRALGELTVIEADALKRIHQLDQTAVFVDTRPAAEFAAATLPGAVNIPSQAVTDSKGGAEIKAAKEDGRLPMTDHNTRVIVFGNSREEAQHVARAIAKNAFHNLSYFAGSAQDLGL